MTRVPSHLCAHLCSLLLAALAILVAPRAAAISHAPPLDAAAAEALERQIDRALDARRWAEAIPLIERYVDEVRLNPIMIYNAACCHAQLGARDKAAETLLRAVKAGFRDFDAMEADADLEPIHDHPTFTAILEARDRLRSGGPVPADPHAPTSPSGPHAPAVASPDPLSCPQLDDWKRRHGEKGYRFESDQRRRIYFATCLDDEGHRALRTLIEREADHLAERLFGDTPPYATFIAIPSPRDAKRYFDDTTTGVYEHSTQSLVARDTGESLQHEFVHLMHYGHMERLRQKHPIWIQEGIATLYERYELGPDGGVRFLPNTRHNLARRAAMSNSSMPWKDLFELSAHDFMEKSQSLYPQVRSIFEFLADRGKLWDFYRTYTKTYRDSPSGIAAMERIFGRPLADVERTWKQWVKDRGALDDTVSQGDASLGITITEQPDGVRIRDTAPRSAARQAGLRIGDVIVTIDGSPTRSMRELALVLAKRKIGESVVVRFRRGDDYRETSVVLRPLR